MANDGTLYLVDPFHWSRMKSINSVRARSTGSRDTEPGRKCCVVEKCSDDAAEKLDQNNRLLVSRWRPQSGSHLA